MSFETLKIKVGKLIEKAKNSSGGLPDWDDDSPIIASGKCTGSNGNTWSLTERGTLRIHKTGTGASAIGSGTWGNIPLEQLKILIKIKQVDVPDGIVELQLYYTINCERVRFPDGFEHFLAFNCYSLKERDYNLFRSNNLGDNGTNINIDNGSLYGMEKAIIPSTVRSITNKALMNCFSLKEINLENITTFGTSVFQYCYSLNLDIVFNEGLIRIYPNAFYGTRIKSATFQNSIDNLPTIDSTAFSVCKELTDIYCPWAEGAVANAPWGATNATIHYNYNAEV